VDVEVVVNRPDVLPRARLVAGVAAGVLAAVDLAVEEVGQLALLDVGVVEEGRDHLGDGGPAPLVLRLLAVGHVEHGGRDAGRGCCGGGRPAAGGGDGDSGFDAQGHGSPRGGYLAPSGSVRARTANAVAASRMNLPTLPCGSRGLLG